MELYKNSRQPVKYLNLVFYAGTLAVNALANILPFNDITTGEVSDLYRTLFAPAPVTFAIWGVIYLLLGFFVIYQLGLTAGSRRSASKVTVDLGSLFLVGSVANMAWIYFWHYQELALTLLFMVVLLVSLIGINLKLGDSKRERSGMASLCVDLPFSIYLGWVSVATIANVSAFLVSIDWNGYGLSPELWTALVMVVAVVLGVIFLGRRQDYAYALVVVWAFAGIYLQHRDYWAGQYPMVQYTALGGIAVLVAFGLYTALGLRTTRRGRGRRY